MYYEDIPNDQTIARLVRMLHEALDNLESARRTAQEWESTNRYLREDLEAAGRRRTELLEEISALKAEVFTLKADKIEAAVSSLDPAKLVEAMDYDSYDRKSLIPLIKVVRENAAIGLKEAKEIVDAWKASGAIYFNTDGILMAR